MRPTLLLRAKEKTVLTTALDYCSSPLIKEESERRSATDDGGLTSLRRSDLFLLSSSIVAAVRPNLHGCSPCDSPPFAAAPFIAG